MDLYLRCLDDVHQLHLKYIENERGYKEYKLDYKYEKNMNKKKIKALKMFKKTCQDKTNIKHEILVLITNRYNIVDKFLFLENVYNDCQNRIMSQLDELTENLDLLRLSIRCYG